jgi:hypothetical protein
MPSRYPAVPPDTAFSLDVSTDRVVIWCVEKYEKSEAGGGLRSRGHGGEQRSFDLNINIGHVLCYDIACAMWIGQQNSGSTNGDGGKNMMGDVLFLMNAITVT